MLTLRQRNILEYLTKQDGYVTSAQLAAECEVSNRTVRADLQAIRDALIDIGANLESRPKVGFRLQIPKGTDIQKMLLNQEEQNTPAARQRAILILLSISGRLTTEKLEQKMLVSRNTIVSDMKSATSLASAAGLQLYAKDYEGTELKGEESALRNFIFKIQSELRKINPALLKKLLLDVQKYVETAELLIHYVEELTGEKFTDEAVQELRDIIPICLARGDKGHHSKPIALEASEELDRLRTGIYIYFNRSDSPVKEGDTDYLTVLFNSSKKIQRIERKSDALREDCVQFVRDYAAEASVAVDFNDNLTKQLVIHLQTAIFRLQHGLPIENSLLYEVQYSSSFLYDMAARLLQRYEKRWEVSVPNTEIAFITIYLEALLQHFALAEEPLRVIIVCHGGMATSTLLRQRLSICMPTLSVTKICRYEDLDSEIPAIRPDLILTTLKLEVPGCPCVRVNPILPVSDMNKINEELSKIAYRKRNFRLIKRIDTNRAPTIEEIIPRECCQFISHTMNWQAAVRQAAMPLERSGKVRSDYAEDMISVVQKMGNYMIFIPEIAFVHSKTDNVIESGIAALFLPEVIEFGSLTKSPVKVIVVVANKEENYILTQLIRLLMIGDNVAQFKRAKTYEDLKRMEGK